MNPVQSLQHMLNHLARTLEGLPRLAETGVFDEATLEAVMIFQRDFGLPVTGIVDQLTWDAIAGAYYLNLIRFGEPPLLHVFPSGTGSVAEFESAAEVRVAQAMFTELLTVFSDFEQPLLDGINTGATTRNLKRIQSLANMPGSGILDRATWAVLTALYRAYITRHAMRTFPLSV